MPSDETTQDPATAYFPVLQERVNAPGIVLRVLERPDFTLAVAAAQAGTREPAHSHPETQVGIPIRGRVEMEIGGQTAPLEFGQMYVVPGGVPHGAYHPEDYAAVIFKRTVETPSRDGRYFRLVPDVVKTIWKSLDSLFFVEEWVEVMLSDIPPGGRVPSHHHLAMQIGVCYQGGYEIEIEGVAHRSGVGDVFVCPPHARHVAVNPFTDLARSVNIFVPPHYHRLKGDTIVPRGAA